MQRSNKVKRRWDAEKRCYVYPRPRGRAPTGKIWQGVDGWQPITGQLDEESIIEEFLQDLVYVRPSVPELTMSVVAFPDNGDPEVESVEVIGYVRSPTSHSYSPPLPP